jgi:eukaryotic-like serine/threonine-protein kinase
MMPEYRRPITPAAEAANVSTIAAGRTTVIAVSGLVNERFTGFGELGDRVQTLVIDVSRLVQITSFGVQRWLEANELVPPTVKEMYLLGCPPCFVDQLNMVFNFAGRAKVLTIEAPYTCLACGAEVSELVDLLSKRTRDERTEPSSGCRRCGHALTFDEPPETYFSFVDRCAATTISTDAAVVLEEHDLYRAPTTVNERPPTISKLVHGPVTFFRIAGTMGNKFRARPLRLGIEGEVVIDLEDVEHFAADDEWSDLLDELTRRAVSLTLVDIGEPILRAVADGQFRLVPELHVWSVLVNYRCSACGNESKASTRVSAAAWPPPLGPRVCSACGDTALATTPRELLAQLDPAAFAPTPDASTNVIARRAELLSRAAVEAAVANPNEGASSQAILGKYVIVRKLSSGGMADVFLAKQIGIGGFEKPVALKRISRQLLERNSLAVDLFLDEAKIAGRLAHPCVAQVLDVGEVGGALYLAMEYVRGKDLRHVLRRIERPPLAFSLFVVREIATALHHAYSGRDIEGKQLHVVHRDVTPHNILLSYEGSAKLADFGVALSSVTRTTNDFVTGKWLYMSPEQLASGTLDHASDLFSLGVVLYRLLVGKNPFRGKDPDEIRSKIRRGLFPAVREQEPGLPVALDELTTDLLAVDPTKRPPSGHAVATRINDIAREQKLELGPNAVATLLGQLFGSERSLEPIELDRLMNESAAVAVGAEASGDHATQATVRLFPPAVAVVGAAPPATAKPEPQPFAAIEPLPAAPVHVPIPITATEPPPRARGLSIVAVVATLVSLAVGAAIIWYVLAT